MVSDRLENAATYYGLGKRIEQGLRELAKTDWTAKPDGKIEIDGKNLFAMVQRYNTKPTAQGKWESHKKYIDIQYVVAGAEVMGVTPLSEMTIIEKYDAEKDVQFLSGHGNLLTISAGMFAIFYPQDAHMGALVVDTPAPVLKIVLKVAVD